MLINQNDFITPDLICGLAAVVVYVLEDKCVQTCDESKRLPILK